MTSRNHTPQKTIFTWKFINLVNRFDWYVAASNNAPFVIELIGEEEEKKNIIYEIIRNRSPKTKENIHTISLFIVHATDTPISNDKM